MRFGPALSTHTYKVFLSSDSTLTRTRELITSMVNAMNNVLSQEGIAVRFEIVKWEDVPPQRSRDRTIEVFVQMAEECHWTIVLLGKRLRPGTKEELEAVVAKENIEISILRFGARQKNDQIAKRLKTLRETVIYSEGLGDEMSVQGISQLVRTLTAALLTAISSLDRGEYLEDR